MDEYSDQGGASILYFDSMDGEGGGGGVKEEGKEGGKKDEKEKGYEEEKETRRRGVGEGFMEN